MRYLFLTLLISISAHAGEWKRTSQDSITFSGEITKEDVASFQKIYRPSDKTLILNSTGGENGSALKIAAILIKNRTLETVVRGVCASSCANYLFLAGKTRKIDGGVVGYHGSLRAYLESEKFRTDFTDLKKTNPEMAAKRLTELRQLAIEEDAFFTTANVPHEIFDRTQRENDMGRYDIYVPGPSAFVKYGIHNIGGKQDMDLMRRMIKVDKIKIFYDNSFDSDGRPSSAKPALR